jgi:acylphosphatase
VKRVHVLVSGEVQGVFFRARCAERARERHVAGWVRNREDGRVEAVFEGEEGAVDAMVAWCREGTPRAEVQDVEVSEEEPKGDGEFRVRR